MDARTNEHYEEYIGRRVRLEQDGQFPELIGEEGNISGMWDTDILGPHLVVIKVDFDNGEVITCPMPGQLRLLEDSTHSES